MKILISATLIFACSSLALASSPGGSDSCGLGWEVTQKKTFAATSTRATTNYVVPSTFGMTSGTIGCDSHGLVKKDQEAVKFVATNYDSLIIEMAQGQGEYLHSLAQLMGCQDSVYGRFGSTIQDRYSKIMDKSNTVVDLFKNVRSEVKNDATLSAGCHLNVI